MKLADIQKLRKKLPAHYAGELVKNLNGIDNIQVSRVFTGEITNPEVVIPVVEAAINYLLDQKQRSEKLTKALQKI